MSKTKFKNAQTIVTEDFLNSLYGGLSGTTEGSTLAVDDPRLIGHVHDGLSADGHAAKINLVSHVAGQLTNTNLADEAVMKRNVYSSTDPNDSNLIPHYEEDADGTKHYYINLGAFDLQGITDNGYQTTNPIVLGRNDSDYTPDSLLTLDAKFEVDESGNLTLVNDKVLGLMLSGKDLFNWNIVGPTMVENSESYQAGILDGNEAIYDESNIPWGIEQRLTHDYFGYVSFVGHKGNAFSLRVVGLGAETPIVTTNIYGSSSSEEQVRSFNANPSITLWYEDANESSDNFGNQYPVGSVGAVKSADEIIDGENASNLIFSIKPDSSANLSKNYSESTFEYGGQTALESDWPLVDVMKVSKYGNVEVKRGVAFSNHSESLINIKEVFGYSENLNDDTIQYHNLSRNIASLRMEPLIDESQSEGSTPSSTSPIITPVSFSKTLVGHHNYIELASIMKADTSNFSRGDGRALSADNTLVEHSNVFKFDRYFINKGLVNDTHRALENNVSATKSGDYQAQNVLPSIDPFGQAFYSPTLMKVNIVEGDTPRDFYVPVLYQKGESYDSGSSEGSLILYALSTSEALERKTADLSTNVVSQYYVNGTNSRNTSQTGYFYPLYTTPILEKSITISFLEYPGITFYMPYSDQNVGKASSPSIINYPNITAYSEMSNQTKYYV